MFSRYKEEINLEEKLEIGPLPDVEDALNKLIDYVKYLDYLKTYDGKPVQDILETIVGFSYGRVTTKVTFPMLMELNFIDVISKMTEYFQREQQNDGERSVLQSYRLCTVMLRNYTDNDKFAKAVADSKLIPLIASNLSSLALLQNGKDESSTAILRFSIGILYNVISNCPESREVFRKNEVKKDIVPYLKDDVTMRLEAIFILAYIIDEDEAEKLRDNDSIPFLIDLIKQALETSDHTFSHGETTYSAEELLLGLARMAINEDNKEKIMAKGGIDVLVTAMKSINEAEQKGAVKTIYSLCFDDYREKKVSKPPRSTSDKIKVKENLECMSQLEELEKSSNPEIKKAAKGALWELNPNEKVGETPNSEGQHIFISYSWRDKDIVRNMHTKLKERYNVWIDIDHMEASSIIAMAEAVENAYLVLVCISHSYKESPNCRTEAEYTYTKRKPIIPILTQRNYEPDGWLGVMVGNKLSVDFHKNEFDTAYQQLVKRIEGYKSR